MILILTTLAKTEYFISFSEWKLSAGIINLVQSKTAYKNIDPKIKIKKNKNQNQNEINVFLIYISTF